MDQVSLDIERELGAVLVKARRFRASLLNLTSEVEFKWYRKLAHPDFWVNERDGKERTTKERVTQLPGVLRMALGEAALAAANHFFFFDLWQETGHDTEFEIELRQHAVSYAHFFVDVVPIQLFNFKMMLDSPEAKCALDGQKNISKAFDQHFPKLTDARHAVAHQHDRNLAARTSFRDRVLFEVPVNDEAFAPNGKTYRDANGVSFDFQFELSRFESFLRIYKENLETECV